MAYLYDWSHRTPEKDVLLYRELAESTGGRALELGCGSGRVLSGLAGAGVPVTGVDQSGAMLDRARVRLVDSGPEVALIRGDMRTDLPGGPFGLVVLARTALGYLQSSTEAVALLRGVGDQLTEGGLLVIDQVNLSFAASEEADLTASVEDAWDPCLRAHIKRSVLQRVSVDEGTTEVTCQYQLSWPDGPRLWVAESALLRCYTLDELSALVRAAGLETCGIYGDYELGPHRPEAERLLLLARRPG